MHTQHDDVGVSARLTTLEKVLTKGELELFDLHNSLRGDGESSDLEKLNARVKEIESSVFGDSVSINHGEFIFTSETEVGS